MCRPFNLLWTYYLTVIGPAVMYSVNTIMRYQLISDDIGNYLIVDTWRNWVLAKATTLQMGARICQNLNKRLGTKEYLNELRQKVLTE